jgi:hypothetical protein
MFVWTGPERFCGSRHSGVTMPFEPQPLSLHQMGNDIPVRSFINRGEYCFSRDRGQHASPLIIERSKNSRGRRRRADRKTNLLFKRTQEEPPVTVICVQIPWLSAEAQQLSHEL